MKSTEKKTFKSQKSLQPRVCKAKKSDTFLNNRYVLIQVDTDSGEEFEVFCTSYFQFAFDLCMSLIGVSAYDDLMSFERSVFKGEFNFCHSISSGYYLSCLRDVVDEVDKTHLYSLYLDDSTSNKVVCLYSSYDIFDIFKFFDTILDVDDYRDLVLDLINIYYHSFLPNRYVFQVNDVTYYLTHTNLKF